MADTGDLGVLIPIGGGDPIPLRKDKLTVGRRPSCDICLAFQNVSGLHCEFVFQNGFWSVHDLKSSNGVKVKGERVTRKPLEPGDEVGISTHRFTIQYNVTDPAALSEALAEEGDLFAESLLEKAGLQLRPEEKQRRNRG